jgi:hypothetical protein
LGWTEIVAVEPMPIRRHSYQFCLGTLLAALTVFTFLVWLGWNVKQVRDRASVRPHLLGSEARDRGDAVVVRLSDTQSKVSEGRAQGLPGGWRPINAPFEPAGKLPRLWTWLGARPENVLYLREDKMGEAQIARIRHLYPESTIWIRARGADFYTRLSAD